MIPRTKLVCTIGPASIDLLDELVAAGMSVARVNLAHGRPAEHERTIRAIRAAEARAGRDIAVLADLPGPKIRLGPLRGGSATLDAGTSFRIGPGEPGDATGATSNHPLAADLRPGDRVLLADGAVEAIVSGAQGPTLLTDVERGGTIRSRAGVAVPSERLSLPAMTDADREALPRLVELEVDLVGLSFVRRAGDVTLLRDALAALTNRPPAIVAKVETRAAVDDAAAILEVADALMVARGDLGVELPFEEVPLLQKRLVRQSLAAGRPVIVATQMLESMTSAPRPTRAEASDVANAALDGADAVMLSGETAIGDFPVESAQAAIRILAAVDAAEREAGTSAVGTPPVITFHGGTRGAADPHREPVGGGAGARAGAGGSAGAGHRAAEEDARAIARAAIDLARRDRDVACIACYTRTGRTATLLAALRSPVPIVAFSADARVRRRLALEHGVEPRPIPAGLTSRAGGGGGTDGADGAHELGSAETRAVAATLASAVAALGLAAGTPTVIVSTTAGGAGGPNVLEIFRSRGAGPVDRDAGTVDRDSDT